MKKMKANRRVMLVTLCILVVFLVTTLPTRIIRIYFTMRHSHEDGSGDFWMDDMDLHLNLVLVSYLTYPFQSNLNPLMYSMLDTEWRKELRIILKHFQTFMIRVYWCQKLRRYLVLFLMKFSCLIWTHGERGSDNLEFYRTSFRDDPSLWWKFYLSLFQQTPKTPEFCSIHRANSWKADNFQEGPHCKIVFYLLTHFHFIF